MFDVITKTAWSLKFKEKTINIKILKKDTIKILFIWLRSLSLHFQLLKHKAPNNAVFYHKIRKENIFSNKLKKKLNKKSLQAFPFCLLSTIDWSECKKDGKMFYYQAWKGAVQTRQDTMTVFIFFYMMMRKVCWNRTECEEMWSTKRAT